MLQAKSMILYTKYLKLQAEQLDFDKVGEKYDEIRDWIRALGYYSYSNEKWINDVETTIAEVVEYINLCSYLCRDFSDGRAFIIPEVAEVIAELCDLKHNILNREDLEDDKKQRLADMIFDVVYNSGRCVTVQDERHWFEISWMFGLDSNGYLKKQLDLDLERLASGVDIKEILEDQRVIKKPEETMEGMALGILKRALDESKTHISVSWVQRKFNFGYGKSSLLLDWLSKNGYIQTESEANKSTRGRKILNSND